MASNLPVLLAALVFTMSILAAPSSSDSSEGHDWYWALPGDSPPSIAVHLRAQAATGVSCLWQYSYRTTLTEARIPFALIVNEPFQRHTFGMQPTIANASIGPAQTPDEGSLMDGVGSGWIQFDDAAPLDVVLAGHGLSRTEPQQLPALEMALTCDGDAESSHTTTQSFVLRSGRDFDGTRAHFGVGPLATSLMRNATTQAVFDQARVNGGLYDSGGHGEVEIHTPERIWGQTLDDRVPVTGGPGTYRLTVDRIAAAAQADGDQIVLFLQGWD